MQSEVPVAASAKKRAVHLPALSAGAEDFCCPKLNPPLPLLDPPPFAPESELPAGRPTPLWTPPFPVMLELEFRAPEPC